MKAAILRQHGCEVKELTNGTVLVKNEGTDTYSNMTNLSISQIYNWLGYY